MTMVLEREQAFFEAQRGHLVEEHLGKFALVKEDALIGTFDTAEAAYVEGVKRSGTAPFLVKEIRRDDPVAQLPALSLGLLRADP